MHVICLACALFDTRRTSHVCLSQCLPKEEKKKKGKTREHQLDKWFCIKPICHCCHFTCVSMCASDFGKTCCCFKSLQCPKIDAVHQNDVDAALIQIQVLQSDSHKYCQRLAALNSKRSDLLWTH